MKQIFHRPLGPAVLSEANRDVPVEASVETPGAVTIHARKLQAGSKVSRAGQESSPELSPHPDDHIAKKSVRAGDVAAREAGAPLSPSPSLPSRLAIVLLGAYKRFLSPILPPLCRFYPSCSVYATQAIEHHGLIRGSGLTVLRLLKCHPLHPGGFDPVK